MGKRISDELEFALRRPLDGAGDDEGDDPGDDWRMFLERRVHDKWSARSALCHQLGLRSTGHSSSLADEALDEMLDLLDDAVRRGGRPRGGGPRPNMTRGQMDRLAQEITQTVIATRWGMSDMTQVARAFGWGDIRIDGSIDGLARRLRGALVEQTYAALRSLLHRWLDQGIFELADRRKPLVTAVPTGPSRPARRRSTKGPLPSSLQSYTPPGRDWSPPRPEEPPAHL